MNARMDRMWWVHEGWELAGAQRAGKMIRCRFYIEKTLKKRENAPRFSTDFLSCKIAGGIAPEERARFGS